MTKTKTILFVFFTFFTSVFGNAQSESGLTTTHDESGFVPSGYELDWSDEFDGDALSQRVDKWQKGIVIVNGKKMIK